MATDVMVTVQHLHTVPNFNGAQGFCARGVRVWAVQRGLCWATFVRDGLPAGVLEATGDAMALRVAAHARALASAALAVEVTDGQP